MHICTCVCVPKYNQLSPYILAYFQGWLTLGNQLVYTFLGKTTSAPRFTCLPLCFCVGLRPPGFSPSSLECPSVWSLFCSYLSSHVDETLQISGVTRRQNLTETSLILWLLQSVNTLFSMFPEYQIRESIVDVSIWTQLHNSAYWLVVAFCSGLLSVAKKKFFDGGWRLHSSVSIKTNVYELFLDYPGLVN